jgi:Rod binding domain-containing protein
MTLHRAGDPQPRCIRLSSNHQKPTTNHAAHSAARFGTTHALSMNMDLALTPLAALPATAVPDAKLKQAAGQFEAYFLGEILKHAEPEPGEEGLLDGDSASATYRQLYHGALAEQASGGLGIADLLMHELAAKVKLMPAPDGKQP